MRMEIACFIRCLILVTAATTLSVPVDDTFNSSSFPPDFIFGAGSSSYQYEGATNDYGRGPCVWDTFIQKYPEKIDDRSNSDVAVDFYHRYKEDIKLMKFEGLNGFRFSISWSRLLPYGKLSKGVNKEGIAFYNNLINELLANGIQPFVTMFHYDMPQALEDEYQGFLSRDNVDDFVDYAELCFREFGDRIKLWSTINDPSAYTYFAYKDAIFPPNQNSYASTFMVGHNLLLAHAKAVKLYRQKYMPWQKGEIGLTVDANMFIPQSNAKEEIFGAKMLLDFTFGWFVHPITYGVYPEIMLEAYGNYIPKFTSEETKMVKGSSDFLALNYYVTYPVIMNFSDGPNLSQTIGERNGKIIRGESSDNGFHEMLVYAKEKYNNPVIYIAENGIGDTNVASVQQGLNDFERVDHLRNHLFTVKDALKDGVMVKGYFAWSFLDNFEWTHGYTIRYGINYVDYNDNLKRYPKRSALWLKQFISRGKSLKFDYE